MVKVSFLAGAAVGYVLGAKAGQKRYQQIKGRATEAWSSDPVQAKVDTAKQALKDHAPIIADNVGEAAKLAGSKIKDQGSRLMEKATGEDLPDTIHRGSDGKLHADTTGFGPGPDKLP